MRVSGHRLSIASMATIFTAVGAIGAASQAEAALYYWQDHDSGFYRPAYPGPQRKPKARRNNAVDKKALAAEKEAAAGAKPQGPLIISISIQQQKVRVYDSNGFFAEGPVSTGTASHPTPMGVFSIIQKHKMHHSNIYSGAPMPFMQRITWSGVAMHQGVLPGYPASHGCIRMPQAFAQKMWNWTKMGARVLVTPGEMTPAPFSHPFLVTQKVVPVAQDAPQVEAPQGDAPLGVKSDKGADAKSETKPDTKTAEVDIKIELRSTVGHALIHTADASGAMPANASVTMTDASPASASGEAAPAKPGEPAATAKSETAAAEPVKAETKPGEAKVETAGSEPAAAGSADTAVDVKPAEIVTGEIKSATTDDKSDAKAEASARAKAEDKAVEPAAKAEAKVEGDKAAPASAETSKPDAAKPAEPKAAEKAPEKTAEPAKATADAPAAKDPSRLPSLDKLAKSELKREGQVAVFISRKDGKLYVRQNFKPVFDVPVTIAPSDRLLGTHVFTAETDKNDPNQLRWSVVSLPVTARNAQKGDDDERTSRRRKGAAAAPVETKPAPMPNGPAEALDRITVPPEVMAKIAEALTSGGSIVVSDQGIAQGETGEGTDFIVRLRN
jgi:lipoprotein-anchoring transpeptidase ErfK/SrfK